jgi:hypothetical protein
VTITADRRRSLVIERVLLGDDATTISQQVGVSVRHVRRILAEPAVQAQIRELDGERLRAVARKAAALGAGAVAVLAKIADSPAQPAAARVSAARALLDAMLKVAELADLAERVAVLERSADAAERAS